MQFESEPRYIYLLCSSLLSKCFSFKDNIDCKILLIYMCNCYRLCLRLCFWVVLLLYIEWWMPLFIQLNWIQTLWSLHLETVRLVVDLSNSAACWLWMWEAYGASSSSYLDLFGISYVYHLLSKYSAQSLLHGSVGIVVQSINLVSKALFVDKKG